MDPILSPSAVPPRHGQAPAGDTENYIQREAKRRKVRKGTRSCWECKRRKMKCIFDPLASTICNGCRRRGSKCVSQEFPEEVSLSVDKTTHEIDDGVLRVETLVDQLVKPAGSDGTTSAPRTPLTLSEDGRKTDHGTLTPAPMNPEASRTLAFYKSSNDRMVNNGILPGVSELYKLQSATNAPVSQAKCERLSQFLHESLPSRDAMERICKARRHPSVLTHETLTMPYAILDQDGLKTPERLLEIPESNLHPALIARHMLQLAIFLQHLHPDLCGEIKGLPESPRAIMRRLVDLAISLVTTNDELLGSIEGLECVMLESMYQVSEGNLRRSWVAGRRAMGIAQLMGLNRSDNRAQYKVLDPKTKYHPQFMWFRIIFLDRYLCLMLGLSQGSLDRSMASDALLTNDTPMGRLERIHCVVASRILERNESHPSSEDLALTQTLDIELQRAARSLPSEWWLPPILDFASNDSQALFWDTQRLFSQILHYNLLNQLHLPYMLFRSSSAGLKHEYSRITCVNASREVLSRFSTLRSFNQTACSCRLVDFLALMAAMTLLLAHLDSHRSEAENPLAHQFYGDRAMIEQAHNHMKAVNHLNSDALSAQSADLLRRLLTIEVETADDYSRCATKVSVKGSGTETALPDQSDDAVVSVHIPYFGTIKIAPEGMSKEVPKPQASATTNRPGPLQLLDTSHTNSTEILYAEPQMHDSGLLVPSGIPNVELMTTVDASYRDVEAPSMISRAVPDSYSKTQVQPSELSIPPNGANDIATHFVPQLQSSLSDSLLQHGEYPELAAGGEDWAFQGVDMAFFDSLMRGVGNEWNEGAQWITWQR